MYSDYGEYSSLTHPNTISILISPFNNRSVTIIITTHVIKARVERVDMALVQASQERVEATKMTRRASRRASTKMTKALVQASQESVKALVQASQERHPLPPPAHQRPKRYRNHQKWWKQSSVYVKSLHGNSSWAPVYVIAAL